MVDLIERRGPELRFSESVTALPGGSFASVRSSQSGYFIQRYNSDGTTAGGEVRLNTDAVGTVTALVGGEYVMTWSKLSISIGGEILYRQMFDSTGAKVGSENATRPSPYGARGSVLEVLSDGGFLYASYVGDSYGGAVSFVTRYDAAGKYVSRASSGYHPNPFNANERVVETSDGGFAVAWQNPQQWKTYVTKVTADGQEVAVPFALEQSSRPPTGVVALTGGEFLVFLPGPAAGSLLGQRFNATGGKVGNQFTLSVPAPEGTALDFDGLGDGDFLVSWGLAGDVGFSEMALRFNGDGSPAGQPFRLNGPANFTPLGGGSFVATWIADRGDGNGMDGYAQVYGPELDGIRDFGLTKTEVREDEINNAVVATIIPDGSLGAQIQYSIISDSTGGAFRIEGDRLILSDNHRLDYETAPSAVLRVRATDSLGRSHLEDFTLAVQDSVSESRFTPGSETRVNTLTVNQQRDPAVAATSDGGYVVTWEYGEYTYSWGGGYGVYAQRFNADGSKAGDELIIGPGNDYDPAVAGLRDGGFAVSWSRGEGIRAQVFNADGSKAGDGFVVKTATRPLSDPSIVALSGGDYVVIWQGYQPAAGGAPERDAVYGQQYSADGSRVGGEILAGAGGKAADSAVTALITGAYVVAWVGDEGGVAGIYAQGFVDGRAGGLPLLVSTTGQNPALAELSDQSLLVTWQASSPAGGFDIYARRFFQDGSISGPFLVNTDTRNDQISPTVTALGAGGFVVSWTLSGTNEVSRGVYAQRFAADGSKEGGEFLVNNFTIGNQQASAVAALGRGFVVSWESVGQDGSGSGVYARTFAPVTAPMTAVADASTTAETSATTISVLANDVKPSGEPAEAVVAINGTAVSAGQAVTLASGARATLNADGTISYDPTGKFNHLISQATAAATGAANSQATDGFSYGLARGSTATVTVTVTGVDGPNDEYRGTSGNDILRFIAPGNFAAFGGAGDDGFYFGANFGAGDFANGGEGADQLGLRGTYGSLIITGAMMSGIETLVLLSGADDRFEAAGPPGSYTITVDDGAVTGALFTVNGNGLALNESMTFNGGLETSTSFLTYAGFGAETLTGGAASDGFFFGEGGRFDPATTRVSGGGGADDQLGLRGDYGALTFTAMTMEGVETLVLLSAKGVSGAEAAAYNYSVQLDDANVASGRQLVVAALGLAADERLAFYGASETNGRFSIRAGAGNDILVGGAGDDVLYGNLGADLLAGNGGNDTFLYRAVTESTAAVLDQISNFASGDKIDFSAIDAIAGGGDDAFQFIGSAAFTAAGQVRAQKIGGIWTIEVNTDGTDGAEMVISATTQDPAFVFSGSDFML